MFLKLKENVRPLSCMKNELISYTSMNTLHHLHSQPGTHGAIRASVDNRHTLLCAVCLSEVLAELLGPGRVTGIFLPPFERMKIHAEELSCLGLAL